MKTRIIWTKIWEDDWFQSLSDPAQKVFLYLITNRIINLSGCYQISDFIIKAQTRVKNLEKVKKELYPKVKFFKDWVYIKNAQGYGGYTGISNEMALKRENDEIPDDVNTALFNDKEYTPPTGSGEGGGSPINNKSEIINNTNIGISKDYMESIASITLEQKQVISEKYKIPMAFIESKLDDLINWLNEKPSRAKGRNLLATLRNWVKRDALEIYQKGKNDKYRPTRYQGK